ncbi:hypothetical protein [Staphylococcus argensis]|uniref:hypothetical protein n=1 Tax=Staphylococcus argensis TaxID=1607738 RepID=UPI001C92E947|nr:hypothetical protein [Staphylococcus argensis]
MTLTKSINQSPHPQSRGPNYAKFLLSIKKLSHPHQSERSALNNSPEVIST